ncbi:MAG: WD40 repeat domain-containing protein [Planctomycetota bacterium]|jgi:hypothetical protein
MNRLLAAAATLAVSLAPPGCSSYRIVTPQPVPAGAVVRCHVDKGMVGKILGFAPGGQLVAIACEKVYLFEATTGRALKKIDGWLALMSPAGLLAIGHRPKGVSLYDLSKAVDHRIFRWDGAASWRFFVFPTAVWDARGGILATGQVLWDTTTGIAGKRLGKLPTTRGLIALSPDGKKAVFAEGHRVMLRDVESGRQLWAAALAAPGHLGFRVTGAKLAPASDVLLVTTEWYYQAGCVVSSVTAKWVLDGKSGQALHGTANGRLAGDGRSLIEYDEKTARTRIVALPSCKTIAELRAGNPTALAAKAPVLAGRWADGPAGEQWLAFWNTNTGQQLARVRLDAQPQWSCQALDPTGRFLICKDGSGLRLCILDRVSGLKIAEIHARRYRSRPLNFAYRRAFSPDGSKVAVALDGQILIIDMARLAVAASEKRRGGRVHLAAGYTPTAERPVVPDVGRPDSYVLFGGEDGTKRIRITWPKGTFRAQASQGGKVAAAFVKSDSEKLCRVVFFDCEGSPTGKATIRFWYPHVHLEMWVGDRSEAVVHLVGYKYMRKRALAPRLPDRVETYYVKTNGEAMPLGEMQVAGATFTARPGFAIITSTPAEGAEQPAAGGSWRLRRYDAAGGVQWERPLAGVRFGRPAFCARGRPDPKTIFSVWCNDWNAVRHYRNDGTYAEESWPK